MLFAVHSTNAATVNYYVDPTGTDDVSHGTGTGTDAWATIQYAITNVANPTSDIVIINISGDTYTTNNDDIAINRAFLDLTLQGANASNTIIQSHSDPDSSTVEVFDVESGNNVTFEDLTIRYGRTTASGAAIQASSGDLTIRDCIIYDNDGISSFDSGGISGSGDLTIENSTFYDNSAPYAAVVYWSNGDVVITNSTFFNNDSSVYMGLYFNGIDSFTMTNSIVTQGTSLELQGSFDAYIKNSIIADNQDSYDLEYYNYYGTVYAENTIIGIEDTDGSAPYITNGVDGNIDINDDALSTINISTSLADNSTIYGTQTLAVSAGSSTIDAGSATANNGVSIPGIDQRGAARAGAVDIGPFEYNGVVSGPAVSTLSPADNATGIELDSNLVITFSEAVDAETGGTVSIYKSDDTLIQTFTIPDGGLTGTGTDTITINPTSDLDEQTSFYIQISATAFDDASSNSYAGISDETTWSFTTADETNPTVSTLSPVDDATGIATTANLTITFNENVDAETGGTVSLYKSDDTLIQTFTIPDGGLTGTGTDTITINPTATLSEQTSYYVQISATAFDDSSSNSYAGITDETTWSFTTADETNPAISSLSPADDATGIATTANLVITFDESVDAETGGTVTLYKSDDTLIQTFIIPDGGLTGTETDTITINLTAALSEETSYYVQISATAFDDASSNSYVGIAVETTWSFATADETNPNMTTLSPTDDATSIATNSNIVITFSEAVDAETGNITLYKSDDTQIEQFDVTTDITGSGTDMITINPTSDLDSLTSYYIQIDATAFDDTSSNNYAGIADETTWSFTTIAPTISSQAQNNPNIGRGGYSSGNAPWNIGLQQNNLSDNPVSKKSFQSPALLALKASHLSNKSLVSSFQDVEDHWAKGYINILAEGKVVSGFDDGTKFKPDNAITRAEFLKISIESLYFEDLRKDNNYQNIFSDININEWYAKYVSFAYKKDVISGNKKDNKIFFRPTDKITRSEAIKIIILLQDLKEDKQVILPFSDVPETSWYKPYVAIAFKNNIISGKSPKHFAAGDPLTRAEATKIIFQSLLIQY